MSRLPDHLKVDKKLGKMEQSVKIINTIKKWKTFQFSNNKESRHYYRFLVYYIYCQVVILCQSIIQYDTKNKEKDVNKKFLEFELPHEVDRSTLIDILDMLKRLHITVSHDINVKYLKKTIFFENRKKEIITIVEKLSLPDYDSDEIQSIIDSFIKHINLGGGIFINDVDKKRDSVKAMCQNSNIDAQEILHECSLDQTNSREVCQKRATIHHLLILACHLYQGITRNSNPPMGLDILRFLRLNKEDFSTTWGSKILKLHREWKTILKSKTTKKKNSKGNYNPRKKGFEKRVIEIINSLHKLQLSS